MKESQKISTNFHIRYCFQISYPQAFSDFVDGFKIFNFSPVDFLPFSCSFSTDYVTSLMFSTLWPIMAVGFLFMVFNLVIYNHSR